MSSREESLTRRVAFFAFLLALFCVPAATLLAQTPTPVPVLTWRYDLTHAGQNTSETSLTPANVTPTSFGKLFSQPVDSTVYAQPLYVPGLVMSDGLFHNVLFVATENDSVYAFDADSNSGANAKPLWQISLLTTAYGAGAGATAVPWADTGSPDVAPTVGITGTPTINPATNTIYLVANTKENGAYFSRLHAINIITGAEQPNSPVNITATVAGTGNGSDGVHLSFSALWENQRTALNYYNGYVYFGYGAHGDNGPWHGWLFAYNATTLAQSAALCLSPNDYGAGVWASGAGMPIDEDAPGGRMFVVTGNGHSTNPPYNGSTEFGESIINFSLANGGLTPTDAFTAFNFQFLNTYDLDLGSGGVVMIPDQQGAYPHILVQEGKEGRIVVLNRDNLGGYAPATGTSNTNALQDIESVSMGLWSTPAYWNGNVYIWGSGDTGSAGDVPKLFKLNSGVMNTTPSSQSTIVSLHPGASFSVSSNGTANGIAWAIRSDQFNTNGPAVLYAWPATDLTTPLYESDTNATRDAAGPANRFSIPMVTNGKVYVPANGQVDVYGLFNGEPNTVAPVLTPNGGTFTSSQSVTLTTTTAPADIFYTVDGSTPTPASTLYVGPIVVSKNTTIKAIATAPGYIQSGVSSAIFTITSPPPSFALSGSPINPIVPGGSATSTLTITPSGGFTGSVAMACAIANGPVGATNSPTCSVTQPAPIAGTQPVSSTLTITTMATTTPGTYSANVTGSSGTLTQTTSVAITISSPPPTPSFALTNTPVSIASPGAGGTSTITVTPSGGFTGSVTLACAITSSPAGAIDPPTCSVDQPAAISGSQPVTSMLTIKTTAAGTAALHNPFERMLKLGGGGTVVALLFFCLPLRRRRWHTLLGLLLFAFVAVVASGCGGNSTLTPAQTGTTPGPYTVTVTGSSGSMQANTPVAVTVQ